jgi:hypothetical protein
MVNSGYFNGTAEDKKTIICKNCEVLKIMENKSSIINLKRTILLLITGVGLVLFWRGIWETSAKFISEEMSLVLGLLILVTVAIYERRQIFQFFGGGR